MKKDAPETATPVFEELSVESLAAVDGGTGVFETTCSIVGGLGGAVVGAGWGAVNSVAHGRFGSFVQETAFGAYQGIVGGIAYGSSFGRSIDEVGE